jgi:hypothetical protein
MTAGGSGAATAGLMIKRAVVASEKSFKKPA